MGTKCRCMVLPDRNSQRCQRNVGPGEAGCSQQSRQDTNPSCRDRVNSGCAEPTPFPSKTSCMHQRFSGNCIKPRRTRESIPHGKPGLRSRWASLLPCSQHWAAWILLPQQVTDGVLHVLSKHSRPEGIQPVFANILADKCHCTSSAGSSKGRGCILGITIL